MPKFGIIDVPSARRAHLRETPRGGGLAFVLIISIALPLFEYLMSGSCSESISILLILLPISFISFLDDISHVMIPVRLFIHTACASLAIMWLVHPNNILHYEIPMKLDLVIGTIALLSFLNVYNFLDGIDGITVTESFHLASTILLLCALRYDIIPNVDLIIMIATIIFGGSFGFVYFNWQPAKIFLGDVGSISLGFLLGICLLVIASSSAKLFLSCVIASLYYIADGGITILIRMVKGEKIWTPHLQHFFQKAVQKGQSHREVVIRIMKCNSALMLLSVNALYYPVLSIVCAILVVMITLIRLVL
ncbi:MAG: glycosyltransferase family 4 protein [Rickettsiaceae bacterium]|nr:glycosyltransferase family 4 protein [Rickettsiaceae bacterium]